LQQIINNFIQPSSKNIFRSAEITLAIFTAFNIITHWNNFALFYSADSIISSQAISFIFGESPFFSFFSFFKNDLFYFLFFALAFASAISIMFKKYTIISSIFILYFYYCLEWRLPTIFSPLDLGIRYSFFWLIFLNLFYSNDHLRHKTLVSKTTKLFFTFQLFSVYFISFFFKIHNQEWHNLSALKNILQIDLYTSQAGKILLTAPELILKFGTLATLFLEGILIFLIFFPLSKKIKIMLFLIYLFFHFFIFAFMNVGGISFLFISWWLFYLALNLDPEKNNEGDVKSKKIIKSAFLVIFVPFIFLTSSSFLNKVFTLELPRTMYLSITALKLQQGWWMFVDTKMLQDNGWITVLAHTKNGMQYNPLKLRSNNISNQDKIELAEGNIYLKKFLTKVNPQDDFKFFKLMDALVCNKKFHNTKFEIYYSVFREKQLFNKLIFTKACSNI
jgi:hypothetical protein